MSTRVDYCDDTDKIGGRHFDIELARFMMKKAEEKFGAGSKKVIDYS